MGSPTISLPKVTGASAVPTSGNPFMQGLIGSLSQTANTMFAKQFQQQQQQTQFMQQLVNSMLKSGSPQIQAGALTLMQDPKAMKDPSKLQSNPAYQNMLGVINKALMLGQQQQTGAGGTPTPGVGQAAVQQYQAANPQGLNIPPPPTGGDPTAGGGLGALMSNTSQFTPPPISPDVADAAAGT